MEGLGYRTRVRNSRIIGLRNYGIRALGRRNWGLRVHWPGMPRWVLTLKGEKTKSPWLPLDSGVLRAAQIVWTRSHCKLDLKRWTSDPDGHLPSLAS